MGSPVSIIWVDVPTGDGKDTASGRVSGSNIDGRDETLLLRIDDPSVYPTLRSARLTLTLPDDRTVTKLERFAPFALFGDKDGGLLSGPPFLFGEYSFEVELFARADGSGTPLDRFSWSFDLAANRPPEPLDDFFVSQGTSTGLEPLENDGDPDLDALTLVSVGDPLGGFIVRTGDSLIYGPNFFDTPNGTKSFIGRDVLDYTVSDGELERQAQIYVDVQGIDGTGEFLVSFADAETDELLGRLQNNFSHAFDLDSLQDVTLVVDVSPFAEVLEVGDFSSIRLILDGGAVVKTENVAPYALFGDDGLGDLFGGGLSAGSHELQVQAFTGRNGGGDLIANAFFSFEISDAGSVNRSPYARDDSFVVEGTSTFLDVLFNDHDAELDPLVIVSATAPVAGDLVIGPDSIGYLQSFFETAGGLVPFIGRDFFEYTISDGTSRPDAPGATARVEVLIEGVEAEGEFRVEVVDPRTDQVVGEIFDGGDVTLTFSERDQDANLGYAFSVSANPFAQVLEPDHIGSLRLTLDRVTIFGEETVASRVENDAPYAVFGDRAGDFKAGTYLTPGDYRMTVEAFTERAAGGDLFSKAVFDFEIFYA